MALLTHGTKIKTHQSEDESRVRGIGLGFDKKENEFLNQINKLKN